MTSQPRLSVCVTRAAPVPEQIEWRIEDWSYLQDKFNTSTKSIEMQCASHSWRLEVYPGGRKQSTETEEKNRTNAEKVAIFLHYRGRSEALRTEYSLTLVNQLPGKLHKKKQRTGQKKTINVWTDIHIR